MSKTIWKSVLKPAEIQEIEVPVGAELLCAREQRNDACVWFRCDPTVAKMERRKIALIGTGHPAPDDGHYLGSVSLHGGDFIFHVFADSR